MIDQDSLKSIEDLHRLKAEGIITETEFEQSKQRILFGARPATKPAPSVNQATASLLDWAILPFKRYVDFQGRSSRKEFWSFCIATAVIPFILMMIGLTSTDPSGDVTAFGGMLLLLALLLMAASLVPLIAVQVRRFHDQERSGWLTAINLVPYVGSVIVLVFMLFEGTDGPNQYGPDPKRP